MKKFGILQTKFEEIYPQGWINPTIVANTHPVFHVKGNGDLVFHRPTRVEYARMKFQEKLPGRLGFQPWRWRAYLQKPEAPEPVKAWAASKVREWAQTLRPVPALRPALVQARRTSTFRQKRKRVNQRI